MAWVNLPLASRIKSASITGRGKFLRVRIQREENEPCVCSSKRNAIIEETTESGHMLVRNYHPDVCTARSNFIAKCLPVASFYQPDTVGEIDNMGFGALVVVPVQHSDIRNSFQRVGVIRAYMFPTYVFNSVPKEEFTLI